MNKEVANPVLDKYKLLGFLYRLKNVSLAKTNPNIQEINIIDLLILEIQEGVFDHV